MQKSPKTSVGFLFSCLSFLRCIVLKSFLLAVAKKRMTPGKGKKKEICIYFFFFTSSKPSRSHCLPFQALPRLSLTVLENPTLSGFKAHRKNRLHSAAWFSEQQWLPLTSETKCCWLIYISLFVSWKGPNYLLFWILPNLLNHNSLSCRDRTPWFFCVNLTFFFFLFFSSF